jgi:hypothetical protein
MNENAALEGYLLEQLVSELLSAIGFTNIISYSSFSVDVGFSLKATYYEQSSIGPSSKLCIVEVESRKNSRIGTETLRHLSSFLKEQRANKAILVTFDNLTSSAKEYINGFNSVVKGRLEVWDRAKLAELLLQFSEIRRKYEKIISSLPLDLTTSQVKGENILITDLSNCQIGQQGWREFEQICFAILNQVFVPPLKLAKEQSRTLSGLEIRDALFSLRGAKGGWEEVRKEFEANFLLCEFKNHSNSFGIDEVNQTRNYLRKSIGRLGIIFSRKGPSESALRLRNSIFSEEKKVILFFDDKHLVELIKLKQANQDPLDLILDAIDEFYISHE